MPATRALGRAVPALAAALLIAACSGTPTGSAASSARRLERARRQPVGRWYDR